VTVASIAAHDLLVSPFNLGDRNDMITIREQAASAGSLDSCHDSPVAAMKRRLGFFCLDDAEKCLAEINGLS